jgi:hypothetical protein
VAVGAHSGQVARSGGLPCGVDWVASEVPAAVTPWAMRYLAAAALAGLSAGRRGVRAPPVLTPPAARLAHGHTRRDGCRGLHQVVYLSDVRQGPPGSGRLAMRQGRSTRQRRQAGRRYRLGTKAERGESMGARVAACGSCGGSPPCRPSAPPRRRSCSESGWWCCWVGR